MRQRHQFDRAGSQESPRLTHNIRSLDLKPSANPANMRIVVLFAGGFLGMGYLNVALESKATMAVVLIQLSWRA